MHANHTHKNDQNRPKECGNAIIIILVMIALLAALTAVAMRSSNRTASNMDSETARMQAEKLMRAAKTMESGVQTLLTVNHCSENELSFQNTGTTRNYTNAATPTDNHCKIFDLAGAGLAYTTPDEAALDGSLSAYSDYGQWVVTGTQCLLGLGSDNNDTCTNSELALIYSVPFVSLPVCLQINNLNNITNPSGAPPTEDFNSATTPFIGSFSVHTDPEIGEGATGVELKSVGTGCFQTTSGTWANSYVFYHVLYAR